MNKELLNDILDILEEDYSKESKEYKFIKSFFVSKTFDKYLEVFKFEFGNEEDGSQKFIEGGYQTQSQLPFTQFVTQNKPRNSKFLKDMLISRREIQKQERGILFDMLETTINSNQLSKTQTLLKKHSNSLDFNGQQLAHIFNKFIEKTKILQKDKNLLIQKLNKQNYKKSLQKINHFQEIKKKNFQIKKMIKEFQELLKQIQNKNLDIKLNEYEHIFQNDTNNGQFLIHQAIKQDNLALIQYINDNHSHQINHLDENNMRPYIMALKLKKYKILDLLISYPKLIRDQDDQIEIILKQNNVNLWGENSIYEYAIKNKLLSLKQFFTDKIKKENIKLCDHEDLFEACQNGNLTQISYIVEIKQKDVNLMNNKQETPLFIACSKGSLEIVQYLIEIGQADPNIKNYRMISPLLLVSDKKYFNILQYLIEQAKVDPNQSNQQGDTALLISCHRGELQSVKYLLEQSNVDINQTNKNGDTALLKATYWNNLEVIQYLLEERNVDIDQKNKNGYNCLLLASKWGYLDIIKYLIEEQNVNIESVTNSGDNILIISADKGHIKIMKYLIEEAHMNINFQNNNGDTVLLRAAYRGEKNIVEYLLELRNVDVDQKNYDGDSALLLSSKQGHFSIVKYLIENQGSNENQENNFGDTALLKASSSGHLDVIKYLIEERKVNVNIKNKNEDNALLLVCPEGKIDVIEYLIVETEIDLNVKNLQGEDVQSFAQKYGYTELLEKREKKS